MLVQNVVGNPVEKVLRGSFGVEEGRPKCNLTFFTREAHVL